MREVIINNDKLVKILEERAVIHENITKLNDQLMELDKERQKEAYKMDRLKDKTAAIIKKNPIEVAEFEYIARVELKDGNAIAVIEDQVEQYKDMIREQKNKQDEDKK